MKPLDARALVVGGAAAAFFGRLLADLGATVVHSSESMRHPARRHHRRFWEYCDAGVEAADQPAERLLGGCDVIVCEPGTDGERERTSRWRAEHPGAVFVAFTPSGLQQGAARDDDLLIHAQSGYLLLTGTSDAPPVKPSVAFLSHRLAAGHALAGLLLARRAPRGSLVDVALRECVLWHLADAVPRWELYGENAARSGSRYNLGTPGVTLPSIFPTADGFVVWVPLTGRQPRGTLALVSRMAETGDAPGWLVDLDWEHFELSTQAEADAFLEPFERYFRSQTSSALFEMALTDGSILAPVQTTAEVLDDPQLAARRAWRSAVIDGATVRIPSVPIRRAVPDGDPAPPG